MGQQGEPLIRVLTRLVTLYVLALALSAGGLSWLGYAVQVKLTNKPAPETIDQKDSPGVKNTKLPEPLKSP